MVLLSSNDVSFTITISPQSAQRSQSGVNIIPLYLCVLCELCGSTSMANQISTPNLFPWKSLLTVSLPQ